MKKIVFWFLLFMLFSCKSGNYKNMVFQNINFQVPKTMYLVPKDTSSNALFFLSDTINKIHLFAEKDTIYPNSIDSFLNQEINFAFYFVKDLKITKKISKNDTMLIANFLDVETGYTNYMTLLIVRKNNFYYSFWILSENDSKKNQKIVKHLIKTLKIK